MNLLFWLSGFKKKQEPPQGLTAESFATFFSNLFIFQTSDPKDKHTKLLLSYFQPALHYVGNYCPFVFRSGSKCYIVHVREKAWKFVSVIGVTDKCDPTLSILSHKFSMTSHT
jgi:hypothetical protein